MKPMLSEFINRLTPWLATEGAENDIVVSTRIRLARNIVGYPFPIRCNENDRKFINEQVRQSAKKIWKKKKFDFIDIASLEPIDRLLLVERQLISKELAEMPGCRSAVIAADESFCLMVNEEDHLRLHSLSAGFEPRKVWQYVNQIDDELETQLEYAFHKQYGYLTACPTNVGTAMRVSVMMHLPALVVTKEIEKVFRSLQKVHLAVRGMYGEGSQAFGDFFQISNQITLGKSEQDIINKMEDCVPQIIEYERKARNHLLTEEKAKIQDRCCRALGVLQTACTIESVETMHHLSSLRLGIGIGVLGNIDFSAVNKLLLQTQPAHIQKITGRKLDEAERDILRAKLIREHVKTGCVC